MDTLTSHAQEQKYMPFKDNIPTALEAQQSVKPTSFYLRAHRIPLPDTIVVNQKLLHGAIKKDSAYIIVVAAYSHNEVSFNFVQSCGLPLFLFPAWPFTLLP